MNYDDAMAATVSFDEARSEIEAHGFMMVEFTDDVGAADRYRGADILDWLGY